MPTVSGPRDGSSPEEFLRGPRWRTRTTAANRHRLAALTFAAVVLIGGLLMVLGMWVLGWSGAPTWVVLLPWSVPTAAAVVLTLVRPRPAEVTDDDDDSWPGYSIRWVMNGEIDLRPAPARVVAAVLFGAPVAWATLVSGVLALVGLA